MKKEEFERKIKELRLEKVQVAGQIQTYAKTQKEFYRENNRDNFYGCYYHSASGDYVIFYTDAERGVVNTLGAYKTEDEAYDNLFMIIKKWKEEYTQG